VIPAQTAGGSGEADAGCSGKPSAAVAFRRLRGVDASFHERQLVATRSLHSQRAIDTTPYTEARRLAPADAPPASSIPRRVGAASPITHVFYVIRENRTYDQVFGDIEGANGDPTRCLFDETITPNAHALAREFGVLDNFYVDAKVSYDGHAWSMGAIR
jgi:hypothetical protein